MRRRPAARLRPTGDARSRPTTSAGGRRARRTRAPRPGAARRSRPGSPRAPAARACGSAASGSRRSPERRSSTRGRPRCSSRGRRRARPARCRATASGSHERQRVQRAPRSSAADRRRARPRDRRGVRRRPPGSPGSSRGTCGSTEVVSCRPFHARAPAPDDMEPETTAETTMESSGRARLARLWIGLIAAWILTGALFKLFWGTPALLPAVVRDVPLELGVVYNLAIGIELAIAAIALVAPAVGWLLQAALLVVFDLVLTTQIAAGDASCGCFGAKLAMPPWVM